MPHYHFISGLPRSSFTLLAAILRQNLIGEALFEHDFENVGYDAPEFDFQLARACTAFDPRRNLAKAYDYSPDLFAQYADMSFWQDGRGSLANVISVQPVETDSNAKTPL